LNAPASNVPLVSIPSIKKERGIMLILTQAAGT